MRAAASIYLRRGSIFVASVSQTVDGFWIENGCHLVSTPEEHGVVEAVLKALDASRLEVPTPRREDLGSQLPELAGVKSFPTFMRGAVSVDVSRDDEGTITLTPMRNGGGRRGFEFLEELAIRLDSTDGLAAALAEALGAAE